MGTSYAPPQCYFADARERDFYIRELRNFVPDEVFDVHAHVYRTDHGPAFSEGLVTVDIATWRGYTRSWMEEQAPASGLYFGFPTRDSDPKQDNDLLADELTRHPGSRGLLLTTPHCDPQVVERRIVDERWAGLKVYHCYADRTDTYNATIDEYLPVWMWELAHRHELAIMLHIVRPRALADEVNQRDIRSRCLRYSGARLILAHAARGFCAQHTIQGLASLRGLNNVYFDTSAICESGALVAIIQNFGTSRLMYGSDFPVSQIRGRNVSVGDGFVWLYDTHLDDSAAVHGRPVINGIESLLALRQAAHLAHLNDKDIERIFASNAMQLLELNAPATRSITQDTYDTARMLIPGGTQLLSKRPEMYAPGCWPAYFAEAHGVEVIDLDQRRFIDMSLTGIGSTLLGYSDPDVNAAVGRRIHLGSMSSLNPPDEVELSELLVKLHPWADRVRYTRTGGEAMSVAVRIARAATCRDSVAFCGYHGWSDWYLAANLSTIDADPLKGHLLSGLEPRGVPKSLADTATPFSYNRLDQLEEIVRGRGKDLAAIIMEPMRHNEPDPGFLEGVRELADRCGAVLIFDEITTGWRFESGGVHLRFPVVPDIAVFSKALGNGFPIAAVLGVARVMEAAQSTFISSTMWTEGVGPAAALATIHKLMAHDVVDHIHCIGNQFQTGLRALSDKYELGMQVGGPACLTQIGFQTDQPAAVMTLYTKYMLEYGFLASAGFYPTFAHQSCHVDSFLTAADEVLASVFAAVRSGKVEELISGKVKQVGFTRLT